ncbi:MAG: transposase [Gemmatimonadetes bacterium]|nr:transposase [Gemmatimonadota bacterium]
MLTDEGRCRWRSRGTGRGASRRPSCPGVRRLPGFDQKVLSLYARGLTVRELQAHLEECYQVEVSPAVITAVTDAVLAEAAAWQQRPLEPVYIAVVLDGLRVKIRTEGLVQQQVIYLALGIRPSGEKEVLGFWLAAAGGGGLLAAGAERPAGARGAGHPDRAGGWAARLSGRHPRGLSPDGGAPVRGAPGAAEPGAGELAGAEGGGERPAGDLPGARRGGRAAGPRRLGRESPGPSTFGDHGAVAAALGAAGPGAGVPGAGPAAALLDQRDREPAPDAAEEPQGAGALPLRGGGEQTAVPGAAERAGEARHAAALGGGAAAHPAPLRGPGPGMAVNQAHTQRN